MERDYRKLNKVLKFNSYPLPNIEEILSSFKGKKVFSALDLRSGYWQIKMAEKDIEKTTFTCPEGLFEFNVLPFGLSVAPPVFQHLMDKVLGDAKGKYASLYLDDLVIASEDPISHYQHLSEIFHKLEAAGLKLKPQKCEFFKDSIKYLGHIISAEGVSPDKDKVKAIQEMDAPETVRHVRSFLGVAGYYRRFISQFADLAKPLTSLTKKNAHFVWGTVQDESFRELKSRLVTAPILSYPDVNAPYNLYTDASLYAVGAVLTQMFQDGEKVIQYVSHQLAAGQQKWPTIEREAYAIVYAVNKLRQYLVGSKFTIYTDHKPLKYLFTSEMKNPRIQRWAILLDEHDCEIKYTAGPQNQADLLSRLPAKPGCSETEEEIEIDLIDSSVKSGLQRIMDMGDYVIEMPPDPMSLMNIKCAQEVSHIQQEDDDLKVIISDLQKEDNKHKDFMMENDILYHISKPVKGDQSPRMQLVIPNALKMEVLHELHSSDYAGHMGIDKTYDRARSRYFWDNMYKDVVTYVQNCDFCRARNLKKRKAPMQDMPIPQYPFQIIGIDICGGSYPVTATGDRYLLTIVDHFTSWPEAYCLKDKSAQSVAQILLEEIIPRHGCPSVILSDNGSEFVNGVISLLTNKLKISHIRTTAYRPQTNGKIERFHRFVNECLSKLLMQERCQDSWNRYIPALLMAYRTSVNETTRFTPYFLLYGRDPILPMDTLLEPKLKYMGDEYVPTMLERLHKAYTVTKDNMQEARDKNKRYHDEKAVTKTFVSGDAVYFHHTASKVDTSYKLNTVWRPYYRIVKQNSPVTFLIRHQVTGETRTAHMEDLIPAHPDNVWDKTRVTYRTVEDEQEEEYQPRSGDTPRRPIRKQPLRQAKLAISASPSNDVPGAGPSNVSPTAGPSKVTQAGPSKRPPSSDDEDDNIPLAQLAKRLREEGDDSVQDTDEQGMDQECISDTPGQPANVRIRQPKRKRTTSPPGIETDGTKRVCPDEDLDPDNQLVAMDDAQDYVMEVEHFHVRDVNVHPFIQIIAALWHIVS